MTKQTFLGWFLVCALVPLAAAKLALQQGWFSQASVNRGAWIQGGLVVQQLAPASAQLGAHQWHLVLVEPQSCAQACARALGLMHQLYTGLGRKQLQVSLSLMANTKAAQLQQLPEINWLTSEAATGALNHTIILVNKQGLALLKYELSDDDAELLRTAGDIRADLLRLMNYDREGA